jgi:hypothetical protein
MERWFSAHQDLVFDDVVVGQSLRTPAHRVNYKDIAPSLKRHTITIHFMLQRSWRSIGKARVMQMILGGEPIGAWTALARGLVSEVLPPAETVCVPWRSPHWSCVTRCSPCAWRRRK